MQINLVSKKIISALEFSLAIPQRFLTVGWF